MALFFRRTGWVLMSLLCVILAVRTLHYFGGDTSNYFQPDIYIDRIVVLRVHIAAGIVAVLAGPIQFVPAFRNRFRAAHRTLGKVYIISVLLAALLALVIATTALGGVVSQAGFSAMAICWAGTTMMAYRRIRNRDIIGHKRWMARSFAITFAFVMLRVIFGTLEFGVGLDHVTSFQITAWACWIPNLLIVEYAIRRGRMVRGPQNS